MGGSLLRLVGTRVLRLRVKGKEETDVATQLRYVEKHFQERSAEPQVPPLRFAPGRLAG
jgi:hypothetical protein